MSSSVRLSSSRTSRSGRQPSRLLNGGSSRHKLPSGCRASRNGRPSGHSSPSGSRVCGITTASLRCWAVSAHDQRGDAGAVRAVRLFGRGLPVGGGPALGRRAAHLNSLPSSWPVALPAARRATRLPTVPFWAAFTSPMRRASAWRKLRDPLTGQSSRSRAQAAPSSLPHWRGGRPRPTHEGSPEPEGSPREHAATFARRHWGGIWPPVSRHERQAERVELVGADGPGDATGEARSAGRLGRLRARLGGSDRPALVEDNPASRHLLGASTSSGRARRRTAGTQWAHRRSRCQASQPPPSRSLRAALCAGHAGRTGHGLGRAHGCTAPRGRHGAAGTFLPAHAR